MHRSVRLGQRKGGTQGGKSLLKSQCTWLQPRPASGGSDRRGKRRKDLVQGKGVGVALHRQCKKRERRCGGGASAVPAAARRPGAKQSGGKRSGGKRRGGKRRGGLIQMSAGEAVPAPGLFPYRHGDRSDRRAGASCGQLPATHSVFITILSDPKKQVICGEWNADEEKAVLHSQPFNN